MSELFFNEGLLKRKPNELFIQGHVINFPAGARILFCTFELAVSTFLCQPQLNTTGSLLKPSGPFPTDKPRYPPNPGPTPSPGHTHPPHTPALPDQRDPHRPSPGSELQPPPPPQGENKPFPTSLPSAALSNRFTRRPASARHRFAAIYHSEATPTPLPPAVREEVCGI